MKKKIIYNILVIITLFAPITTYLALSATILRVKVDFYIMVDDIDQMETLEKPEIKTVFIYSENNNPTYVGGAEYIEEVDRYGIGLYTGSVLKVRNGYYKYVETENGFELKEFSPYQIKKEESWKMPLTLIFSFIGMGIVGLIFAGKLKFMRRYMKTSILISLMVGWLFSLFVGLLATQVAEVFLIFGISYAIYLIEHAVYYNLDKDAKKKKEKSDTLKRLEEIMKNF